MADAQNDLYTNTRENGKWTSSKENICQKIMTKLFPSHKRKRKP